MKRMPEKLSAPTIPPLEQDRLDELCINTIRTLAMDAVEKAQSGHPGMPMGAAAMAYVLWTQFLRHNPRNPEWPNRDRFVLSAGHGSMLLYALLHLTGYDLSLEELQQFRQWGSRTPGHPEHGLTPGVEATTGPLGQGFGNGVGMAISERYLAARFNRPGHALVDHFTYAIVSDGDLMEGVSSEAASLAGHLKLGKLIYLYDDNHITIEGKTELAFSENVSQRFEAYGWHVQEVDGNDLKAVTNALAAARAELTRPSLIRARTHIAYGSPHKQDTAAAHGSPLGAEEVQLTKKALGWPLEPAFYIPPESLNHFREAIRRGQAREAEWQARFDSYASAFPDLAEEWRRAMQHELPAGWESSLPQFLPEQGDLATRQASGKVINAIAPRLPSLIGGSADLSPSTDTLYERLGGLSAFPERKKLPFWNPGTCHGRHSEWNGPARRDQTVWRHLPGLLRLYAALHPPGGDDKTSGDLHFHPRQHRTRRGWTDAPAHRTTGCPAGHSEPFCHPAGGRHRDSGGLAGRPGKTKRPGGFDPDAPEAAGAGSAAISAGGAAGERSLRSC